MSAACSSARCPSPHRATQAVQQLSSLQGCKGPKCSPAAPRGPLCSHLHGSHSALLCTKQRPQGSAEPKAAQGCCQKAPMQHPLGRVHLQELLPVPANPCMGSRACLRTARPPGRLHRAAGLHS